MKCIKCIWEKIEFSCMLQRPRLISTKIYGDLSFAATMIKQPQKMQGNSQGWRKDSILLPRGGMAEGPWLRACWDAFDDMEKTVFRINVSDGDQ